MMLFLDRVGTWFAVIALVFAFATLSFEFFFPEAVRWMLN